MRTQGDAEHPTRQFRSSKLPKEPIDPRRFLCKLLHWQGAVNHVLRDFDLFRQRHLGADALSRLCFRQVISRHEARKLRRLVGGDDNDPVLRFVCSGFNEQCGIEEYYRVRIFCHNLLPATLFLLKDIRMNNRLKPCSLRRIIEDNLSESLAIQCAVRAQHAGAERSDDGPESRAPRRDSLTRQHIRINKMSTALDEQLRYRALPGRNAPRQSDS
jgi:hypothetical protein